LEARKIYFKNLKGKAENLKEKAERVALPLAKRITDHLRTEEVRQQSQRPLQNTHSSLRK